MAVNEPPPIEEVPSSVREWLDQEHHDLVGLCRSFLRYHAAGEAGYRFSLTPAANWDSAPVHGGEQDRRFAIAVTEADLSRALTVQEPLLRAIGHLYRRDARESGWTRRWDYRLGGQIGEPWRLFRDRCLQPGPESTYVIQLARVYSQGRNEAAVLMADYLGAGWLRA